MAKSGKAARSPSDDIELRPDGWERFEKAIDAAVKPTEKPRRAVLRLWAEGGELSRALSALRLELDREFPRDMCQIVFDLLKRPEELVQVETDISAAATGEVTVRFEPSDRLGMLLAALRTGNFDRLIVEKSRHG
jgi:hypothetical protein